MKNATLVLVALTLLVGGVGQAKAGLIAGADPLASSFYLYSESSAGTSIYTPDGKNVVNLAFNPSNPNDLYVVTTQDAYRYNQSTNQFTFIGNTNGHLGGPVTMAPDALSAVPEPATLTMLGISAVCQGGYGWRRRKQAVTA